MAGGSPQTNTERPLTVFASPGRYVQGPGATHDLAAELERLGLQGPVLFVAGSHAVQQLAPIWNETLPARGLQPIVEQFGGQCTVAEITRLSEVGRANDVVAVVSAGGGKASDSGRGAADALNLPAILTPTLASTDAPCSALSVIYNDDDSVDEYRFYAHHPALVLVDSEVIARSPKRQLVSGIGDAIATWYEARTVSESGAPNQLGGLPTATGTGLAKLCAEILLADGPAACAAMDGQEVTPALERLIEANTLLSGLGFESGGLAVAHSVYNGMSAVASANAYLHGEKVAFGLITQLVLEGQPQSEIDMIIEFQRTVGLPITLAEVGIDSADEDAVDLIAETTVAPGETCHHEPFEVRAGAVRDAMLAADKLGRAAL